MISKKRRNLLFLEAGILTFLIYVTAIFLTGIFDNYRIDYLQERLQDLEISESSYVSQKEFSDVFLNNDCDVLKKNIFLRNAKLRDFGEDIGNFGTLFLESNEYEAKLNQRSFYLSEIELYEQILNYNVICKNETIVPVFYFFRESSDFDSQGAILEQFSLNYKNKTLVFTFDFDFQEDFLVNLIKDKFEIESTPYIKVGNKTLRSGGDVDASLNEISIEFLKQRGDI